MSQKEILEVKDKIVLVRTENELEDKSMTDMSRALKDAGALEVIFAIGEYADLKLELFEDSDLNQIGLCRIVGENGKKTKAGKRSKISTTH